MNDLWVTLVPIALAGALVPVQIVMTVLLLRSPGGARVGGAFVAGLTTVRLLQGVVFGLLLSGADEAQQASGPGTIGSAFLVVLGVLLYVTAARSALGEEDADAPPPRWMSMTDSMSGTKAFALGAGFLAIAPKFWVFTLSAIAAIEEADLSRGGATAAFLGFVVLTQSVVLTLVAMTALAPQRSGTLLDALAGWLERRSGALVVILGLVFGTWFLLKGLGGLGVI
jgi:threonine/homoserine/homoserine lactone efflux protein